MPIRSVFDRDLQKLHDNVLRLGSMVDAAIGNAMQALKEHDQELARQVIVDDERINEMRFRIEEGCLKLIACQQPAAGDLRFIVAAMNIALDLERMGDHAAGIATVILRAEEKTLLKPPGDLARMAEISRAMLQASLDAFILNQAQEALIVTEKDEQVDLLYNRVFRKLVYEMIDDPRMVAWAMYLLFCAHNVERIADRVTNICERVVFVVTGRMEEIPSEV